MNPFLTRFGIHLIWMSLFIAVVMGTSLKLNGIQEFMLVTEAGHSATAFRIPEFAALGATEWDALHVGSSTCYRSMDPHVFADYDLNTFNLCSSSQTFFNSYYVLKWAFDRGHITRCVTLDLQPNNWSGNGLESTRDFVTNNDRVGDAEFQEMAWASWDPFNIILANYFRWKRKHNPVVKQQLQKETYHPGGFVESHLGPMKDIQCESQRAVLSSQNNRYLKRIMTLCEAKNIHLILINPPILCEPNWTLPIEYSHIDIIDGMEWEHAQSLEFHYDEVHLRGDGAKLYSRWIAPKVRQQLDGVLSRPNLTISP